MTEVIYKLAENDTELQGAYEVRRRVFTDEQGIAEELVFARDENTDEINVIVRGDSNTIGTARVVFPNADTAKLERMAVLPDYRDRGIGKGIISFLHAELKWRGIKHTVLHAQHQVVGFYKKYGYRETGQPFEEAGIRHVKMEMKL